MAAQRVRAAAVRLRGVGRLGQGEVRLQEVQDDPGRGEQRSVRDRPGLHRRFAGPQGLEATGPEALELLRIQGAPGDLAPGHSGPARVHHLGREGDLLAGGGQCGLARRHHDTRGHRGHRDTERVGGLARLRHDPGIRESQLPGSREQAPGVIEVEVAQGHEVHRLGFESRSGRLFIFNKISHLLF